MTTTTTIEMAGHTYTATLEDGRISISQDGVWAGSGRWAGGRIEDCAARLGDDDSEAVYEAIEAVLAND